MIISGCNLHARKIHRSLNLRWLPNGVAISETELTRFRLSTNIYLTKLR